MANARASAIERRAALDRQSKAKPIVPYQPQSYKTTQPKVESKQPVDVQIVTPPVTKWTPTLQAKVEELQSQIEDIQQTGSRNDLKKIDGLESQIHQLKYENDPEYKQVYDEKHPPDTTQSTTKKPIAELTDAELDAEIRRLIEHGSEEIPADFQPDTTTGIAGGERGKEVRAEKRRQAWLNEPGGVNDQIKAIREEVQTNPARSDLNYQWQIETQSSSDQWHTMQNQALGTFIVMAASAGLAGGFSGAAAGSTTAVGGGLTDAAAANTAAMSAEYVAPTIATSGTTAAGVAATEAGTTAGTATTMPLNTVEGYTAGTEAASAGTSMPLTTVEGYTAGASAGETSVLSTIIDGAVEGAVKGAIQGGLVSAATGGDVLEGMGKGALTGALGGGIGAGIGSAMPSVAIEDSPILTSVIDSGVKQSLTSGAVAAVTGGDVGDAMISGGLIGAAAPLVENFLPKEEYETLNPTVSGAVAGGVNAGVTGGSVVNGIIGGALSGFGGAIGGAPGAVIGALVGNEFAPVHTPPAPVQTTAKKQQSGMSRVGSMIKTGAETENKPYESPAVKWARQKRGY